MIFRLINYIECYKFDVIFVLLSLFCILIMVFFNLKKCVYVILLVIFITTGFFVFHNFKQKYWLSQLSSEEFEFPIAAYNNYINKLQLHEIQKLYMQEVNNPKHGRNASSYLCVAILININSEESSKFFQAHGYPLSPYCSKITPVRHFRDDKNPYEKNSIYFTQENAIKVHNELIGISSNIINKN